jgi:hypothetical protein
LDDNSQLLPRDKLLRDKFTPAETILFGVSLVMFTMVCWIGDPRSFWLLGGLLIVGSLTPFILKTHQDTHPFFIDRLWLKFWRYTAPAWILSLQFSIGLIQNPLEPLTIGPQVFQTIKPINIWLPSTAADSSTWLTTLGFAAAFITASALYIIPKSRYFFERLFPWLCFGAVLVGTYGYLQKSLGLTKSLFTNGTGANDFFAFFPYDGHWAAFASLWCCACIAMALLSMRYDDSPDFIESVGPWYLSGGVLLGASGFMVQTPLPSAILLLTLASMLFIFAVDFQTNKRDTHHKKISVISGLAACLFLSCGLFRIFQENAFSEQNAALRRAAYDMFTASPIFGWGIDSFGKLLPFYASDMLLGQHSERASSDLLQLLAECGIVGLLIALAFLAAFITHYLRGQHNIRLTNHLFIGCGAVLLLAICDTPLMSPAVFFSFLTIFFSALRWANISRNKVDEVDASRPQLVTHESKRRVPFFNTQYQEKEK